MKLFRLFSVVFVACLLGGCAVTERPANPAFEQLSARAAALIQRSYPDAKIATHQGYLAASARMKPPGTTTTPVSSNAEVYLTTYAPQKDGFNLEMYLADSAGLDDATEPLEKEAGTWYPGYSLLTGTQQVIHIAYGAGPNTPNGFNRAMKSLIHKSVQPYGRKR